MARRIVVFGASGHAKVIGEAASAMGYELLGWADEHHDKRGAEFAKKPVLAIGVPEAVAMARSSGAAIVVGIGDNHVRCRLFEELQAAGIELATVVHPAAYVSPTAELASGCVILPAAVVHTGVRVDANCIVNTAASLDHDCVLGPHVHVSPGARLGGGVHIGEGSHIGIGASVIQNVTVGSWSTIGAGAAVIRDLPSNVIAHGVPARVQRRVEAR